MKGGNSRDFASGLLTADSPQEVGAIVEEMEEDREVDWVPLGREPNNYGTVQTQASHPMPCLVELKTNADDAVLIRAFEENAPEDADPDDYPSMQDAADAFVEDEPEVNIIADGSKPSEDDTLNLTIRDNGCGQRPENFEQTFLGIHTPGLIKQEYSFTQGQYGMGSTGVLQFCGDKEVGCYKLIASASHRRPGEWSWSLIRQNRNENQYEYCRFEEEIPTFQGKFGKELAEKGSSGQNFDPQEFGSFVKVYDYRINTSKADISGQEPFLFKLERYVVDSPLKLDLTETRYSSTTVNQNSTRGFWPSVNEERYQNLIEGTETISYDFSKTGSEILGERDISVILFKSDEDLFGVDTTSRAKNRFVQRASKSAGIHKDHAIMFTVNGQTHGDQGKTFLKNRCGFSKTASDTVVIMRFDDFADPDLSDIFKPTRDRLQSGKQEAKNLLAGLEAALESSDMLQEEENRRRARRGSKDTEYNTESFEEFVDENPEFATYMQSGQKVQGPRMGGTGEEEAGGEEGEHGSEEGTEGSTGGSLRSGPLKLPSYLRLVEDYKSRDEYTLRGEGAQTMEVEIPINKSKKVRLATDAQSDYLTREKLGGDLKLTEEGVKKSVEHRDGLMAVTIEPTEEAEPGETDFVTIRLTRPDIEGKEEFPDLDFEVEGQSRREAILEALTPEEADSTVNTGPLYEHLRVNYLEKVDETERGPSVSSRQEDGKGEGGTGEGESGSEGTGSTEQGSVDIPDINFVYEDDWDFDPDAEDFDPESIDLSEIDISTAREFDENVVMRLDESQDGSISGLTLTVNMDAAPLRSFIQSKNVKDSWKEYVENQYQNAVVFFTVSQYREIRDSRGESLMESEIGVIDIIEDSVNGMGQIMLPILFGPNELEDITE